MELGLLGRGGGEGVVTRGLRVAGIDVDVDCAAAAAHPNAF